MVNVAKEQAVLERLTVAQLRERYADVCGEPTRSGNKTWLMRRILWRLQANAEGDLSERARRRAAELADDSELRKSAPRVSTSTEGTTGTVVTAPLPVSTDARLPMAGTVLTRIYKGGELRVAVLASGFEWEGEVYRSLSAVAKAITGSHCSGHAFFGLAKKGTQS